MKELSRTARYAFACFALLAALTARSAAPLADAVEISAGASHACARTVSGGVWCWGANADGQLGDGSAAGYPAPLPVSGLSSGVVAIAAGGSHTCALTASGGVKCWGSNSAGQLGDGTTTIRLTPVDVPGLTSGVVAIWAGHTHTCAVTASGGVKCWGSNSLGQLGDGTTTDRRQPVDVVGLASGISGGAAGSYHNCALVRSAAYCWGYNFSGQLGDGTQVQRNTPVPVTGASGVASIRAGAEHTCAVTAGGAVLCWGSNNYAQLGIGSVGGYRTTPQAVAGLSSGVASLAVGAGHACAVLGNGGAKCWGANDQGQLGNGTTASDGAISTGSTPVDVAAMGAPVTAMAAGGWFTCAIGNDAEVRCWGGNIDGALGRGTGVLRDAFPALVNVFTHTPMTGAISISAGVAHACVLLGAGGVQCWGSNRYGELGDGSTTNRGGPLDVVGLSSGVVAIASGYSHSCVVTAGSGVKCWGRNQSGQLGDGSTTDRATPVDVPGVTGATAIWAGSAHTCAALSAGGVKCWGDNAYGQLGDGTGVSPRLAPVDVTGLGATVVSGAAGERHSCALTSTGGLKCWGYNAYGEVGDGTTTQRAAPVDVSGLASGVAAVDAGDNFTCALTSAGGVRCWGLNSAGRLGIGTNGGTYPTPQTPIGLASGVSRLAVGINNACATVSAGGVRCWGYNFSGELGFPGTVDSLNGSATPGEVRYLFADPVAIAVGSGFQCVTTSDNQVKCWGGNRSGQLGRGYVGHFLPSNARTVGMFGAQTIAFPAIADRDINNSPFTVTVSASSGLAVTLTSLTTSVCTVSATSVTLRANGTCSIAADQAGNLDVLAAARVVRSFIVTGSLPLPGRLVNISSRAQVQTGHNVLIAGFMIAPFQCCGQQKTVVIRARGPSLTSQGVTGVLANPKLQVYQNQTVIASNDDWQQASNASAIQASGFAPLNPAEPAVMLTLPAGGYTAIVSGADSGTGVAIVEVFEMDRPNVPLFNISTRAQVLTGNDVLIGGFIVQGEQPRKILVRARGPSMAQQGVTGLLSNPMLQVFSGQTQIAVNDDWQTDPNAGQLSTYWAPTDPRESAIVVTLNPGAYTAIVSGVGGTTGIGIVEVFDLGP